MKRTVTLKKLHSAFAFLRKSLPFVPSCPTDYLLDPCEVTQHFGIEKNQIVAE